MAGEIYTVKTSTADLTGEPEDTSVIGPSDSQLLFGESFRAEKEDGEWIYGTSLTDGYTGWVRAESLAPQTAEPTHFVDALWTHIYPEPDFKTRPVMGIGFLSRLTPDTTQKKKGFISVPPLGWVVENKIKSGEALGSDKTDVTDTALRFEGCPYLYGGRTATGLDCSALVQLGLLRSGTPCPRDSREQRSLGRETDSGSLQRGDLVFFGGHVGIMLDDRRILNATARTMDVRIEKLSNLTKKEAYGDIAAVRRLDG